MRVSGNLEDLPKNQKVDGVLGGSFTGFGKVADFGKALRYIGDGLLSFGRSAVSQQLRLARRRWSITGSGVRPVKASQTDDALQVE